MPINQALARKSTYPDRIDTNNKIEMEDGDYEGTIHDAWIYGADADGRYTKNKADVIEERLKFTITLDDSDIALGMDLPIRIGKKTFYSSVLVAMVGVTDLDKQMEVDPKDLVGQPVIATLECSLKYKKGTGEEYFWTNVKAIRPKEARIRKPAPRAAQSASPARAASKSAKPNPVSADDASYDIDDNDVPF